MGPANRPASPAPCWSCRSNISVRTGREGLEQGGERQGREGREAREWRQGRGWGRALARDFTIMCALQTGKICGLVTDTPSSMQKLWRLVEAAMPKVLTMGCWAHILNLLFTDTTSTTTIITIIPPSPSPAQPSPAQPGPSRPLPAPPGPAQHSVVLCGVECSGVDLTWIR
ncbi:hypothetical protein QJQ45_018066 [Haematococcus lacustris]|nr:hypothetical protein QJQ45_018066 [Haematococcus lacustris]